MAGGHRRRTGAPDQVAPNITIFGWFNEDGTIEWRRDKIIDKVRAVIQTWNNSDAFLAKYDKMEFVELFDPVAK